MKFVNIFIAGAKDLATQRKNLKALIGDINHKNRELGRKVCFNVSSYETFGDNQEEYDEYIRDKADLVIFVLKDRIGDKTKNEFVLSQQNFNKKGKPAIAVYLNKYENKMKNITFIEGLMSSVGKYYFSYENDEDLNAQVKDYLLSKYNDEKKSIFEYKGKLRIFLYIFSVAIIVLLLVFLLINRKPSPILLIAGGGSARNYIEKYHDVRLESYSSSYYVHMPSGNAWLLLTEEVITPQEKVRYYPICISASAATENDFLKITSKEHFLKSGSVISLKLGYDTLAVCVKDDSFVREKIGHESIKEKEISLQRLSKLIIEQDSINIFATSPGSGTRTTYERLFAKKGIDLDGLFVSQFSEYSDMPTINKNNLPYILLESKCYTMKELEGDVRAGDALELKVYDEVEGRREYSCKPIYLYFMAYKETTKNVFSIPKQTIKFLEDLDCNISGKIQNNLIKARCESVILDFETDLQNWY